MQVPLLGQRICRVEYLVLIPACVCSLTPAPLYIFRYYISIHLLYSRFLTAGKVPTYIYIYNSRYRTYLEPDYLGRCLSIKRIYGYI